MSKKQKNFSNKILRINPAAPQTDQILKAADIIKKGGIILFPTTCLYGLGADAFDAQAVDKIFDIKQRSYQKPILVLIHDKKELAGLVKSVPPAASYIMDNFWPGRVTLVFEAKDTLPDSLTAGTGKIGVRLCGHPVASAVVSAVGGPVTGTSANLSGQAGCSQVADLDSQVAEKLDLILNAGLLKGGMGSTVVDVTPDVPQILREGIVSAKDIFAVSDRWA
ncbi:L-threonylcarbamoyladenylate synthase [Desulfonema magnum]|uniref:L-threonylcarbamoyladenylate synthase n=1 Tax=Desulfonema magnum TaxID=45655 RepID=A0A975BR84_9BACT|nr:L-threonylcarbamoyladenylate synthase [Desulfonema magnum]QTA90226.1 Sua5/YciO/YrdC/YwlC family protein [Desulfonema magnum]